jgi:hypothetical protein
MTLHALYVGSLRNLVDAIRQADFQLNENADVVILPTAAAFTGLTPAALLATEALSSEAWRVEGLMVGDRTSADEEYFARRLREADLVVVTDGAPLHARTTWRGTKVGEALQSTTQLVAIGGVASVFGDVMIDPRGGAPTTGLGIHHGVVVMSPTSAEQLQRTQSLMDENVPLAVVHDSGRLTCHAGEWRVVGGEVELFRGSTTTTLP